MSEYKPGLVASSSDWPLPVCDTNGKLADEITRLRAGLQRIVEGDGFWDAPSIARDLLEGKDVT
jgi:hypothetical protein